MGTRQKGQGKGWFRFTFKRRFSQRRRVLVFGACPGVLCGEFMIVDPLPAPDEPDYLRAEGSWLNTRDHKRIALMFYGAVLLMFFLGGVFALFLRTELLTPNRTIMNAM